MVAPYRVLYVSRSEDSEKAKEILKDLNAIVKEIAKSDYFKAPFLITEDGTFEGLETIRTYLEGLRFKVAS